MAEYVLPLNPAPAEVEWRILDNTAVDPPGPWGGMQSVSRPGARWACRITWQNLNAANRHRLMALAASLRGRANRLWVTDVTATLRGSMSAPELLTNADFSNGTTGYDSSGTLTVRNQVARIMRPSAGAYRVLDQVSAATVAQYYPHALRVLTSQGRGTATHRSLAGPTPISTDFGTTPSSSSYGLRTLGFVPFAASAYLTSVFDDGVAGIAGDYLEVPFNSAARCILADGGSNAMLYSDQLDNAAWTKSQATVTANSSTAPDGTLTGDLLTETAVAGAHYANQVAARTSVEADLCGYGFFKVSTLSRSIQLLVGNDGATAYGYIVVNLSTGAVTTAATAVGTASNARGFVRNYGDGWYFVALVVRCPAAATLQATAYLHNGTTDNYTGTTGAVIVWRLGAAVSSVPTRGAQTTSTAAPSGASQTGSAIHVKGLTVSTSGLLLAGDPVEIIAGTRSHYARLIADLDSDAAGMGYMQFEPACPWQIADNAAVIVQKPMVKMMAADGDLGWPTRPGLFSDFSLELVQDPT